MKIELDPGAISYEGPFKEGKRHGRGIITYSDGTALETYCVHDFNYIKGIVEHH